MISLIFVQAFTASRFGVIPDDPIEVDNPEHAYRLAERLARQKPGAAVFYKFGGRTTVLASYGRVPETFLEDVGGLN